MKMVLPAPHTDASARDRPVVPFPAAQRATLRTLDGRTVASGDARLQGSAASWSASLAHLDQPGNVARLFFAEGVRDIVITLADGRSGRARITGTSFLAGNERVVQVTGSAPLSCP